MRIHKSFAPAEIIPAVTPGCSGCIEAMKHRCQKPVYVRSTVYVRMLPTRVTRESVQFETFLRVKRLISEDTDSVGGPSFQGVTPHDTTGVASACLDIRVVADDI